MSPGPSQSSNSGIEKARRCSLEDGETIPSSHSTNPNGFSVLSTEDVKPDPGGLSSSAQQLSTTNGLGKRELKLRVVNDEDENLEPDATKLNVVVKREAPPVVTLDSSDESSSEEEKPIRYFGFLSSIQ